MKVRSPFFIFIFYFPLKNVTNGDKAAYENKQIYLKKCSQ